MLFEKYFKACVRAVLISLIVVKAQAQVGLSAVITTAAPSLRIPVDVRGTGMGNTGIATTADAASVYWNAAKAAFGEKKTAIGADYTPWEHEVAAGMYLLGASGYHRLDTLQAVTASVRYFNMGKFQVKDMDGNALQSFTPHEWSVSVGYARRLSEVLSLGLTLRYLSSSLASGSFNGTTYKTGTAVMADIGLYYQGRDGFSAGLALSNLGSKPGYTGDGSHKDFLPANAGFGAGYTVKADEENTVQFAVDVNKLLVAAPAGTDSSGYYSEGVLKSIGKGFGNAAWQYGAGVEYTYHQLLSLRAGYYGQTTAYGGQKGFTAGIGLSLSSLLVNFSYLAPAGNGLSGSQNPLSNTLRFGVGYSF